MKNKNNGNSTLPRDFKKPVSWLLGRQLLAGLKYIAVYSLMGDKLDAKDWMQCEAEPTPAPKNPPDGQSTYWFDFIADTGDGMLAVYNIARLCLSDVWLDTGADPEQAVSLEATGPHPTLLPRGEFLFVGGDVAYHIADVASLKERFQTPFNWAYEDLTAAGRNVDKRPIYGIPANHDYYDALDGFNRQIRRPFSTVDEQLALDGFERRQEASYVAVELPFGWQLWGFDSQYGKMDLRQKDFFQRCAQKPADKLIVVTPEPTTVFGKWQSEKAEIVETFEVLDLQPSFLAKHDGELDKSKCRLDLSGDIHHYERYWGTERTPNYASVVAGGGGAFLHPSHTGIGEVEPHTLYPCRLDSHRLITQCILNPWTIATGGFVWLAGALAGLLTYFALTVPESTWSTFKYLFGLFPGENRYPVAGDSGLSAVLRNIQTALETHAAANCCSAVYFVDLAYISVYILFLVCWILYLHCFVKRDPPPQNRIAIQIIRAIGGLQKKAEPWLIRLVNWTDPILEFCIMPINRLIKILRPNGKPIMLDTNPERITWRAMRHFLVLPVLILSVPLFLWIFRPRNGIPGAFLASLLVELFSVTAVLLFVLNRKYSDILNERALKQKQKYTFRIFDLYPLWIFGGILAPLFAGYGFLHYGIYPASVMTFNLLVILVWTLLAVGLPALAYLVGGFLLNGSAKPGKTDAAKVNGRNIFIGIGAWHAVLQLAIPAGLLLYADWPTLLAVTALAVAATEIARRVFSSARIADDPALPNQRAIGKRLLIAWVLLGAAVLAAAVFGGEPVPVTVGRLVVALLLGALFSCLWFGWYLAVSLAFNGHNNEAGGGARSQRYRHMIRFAVQENSLTGYVIGIDTPYADTDFAANTPENRPKFRLVDKFTIELSKAGGGPQKPSV